MNMSITSMYSIWVHGCKHWCNTFTDKINITHTHTPTEKERESHPRGPLLKNLWRKGGSKYPPHPLPPIFFFFFYSLSPFSFTSITSILFLSVSYSIFRPLLHSLSFSRLAPIHHLFPSSLFPSHPNIQYNLPKLLHTRFVPLPHLSPPTNPTRFSPQPLHLLPSPIPTSRPLTVSPSPLPTHRTPSRFPHRPTLPIRLSV